MPLNALSPNEGTARAVLLQDELARICRAHTDSLSSFDACVVVSYAVTKLLALYTWKAAAAAARPPTARELSHALHAAPWDSAAQFAVDELTRKVRPG